MPNVLCSHSSNHSREASRREGIANATEELNQLKEVQQADYSMDE
ncbi:MAG: hypothetical protein V7K53_26825 [Nostoc sp.]